MEHDGLEPEYRVYLRFKDLGYSRQQALDLLAINMEMLIYEEMEKTWIN